jgi:hypothetical protein
LFVQEELLCDALGIKPRAEFANQVPSEEHLNEFEAYIEKKNDEKVRNFWLSIYSTSYYDYWLPN